jgi:type III restriction enzyme
MAKKQNNAVPAPEALVQAPVESPIICSPYSEPKKHWVYKQEATPYLVEERRPASYWYQTVKTGSAQSSLFQEEERDDLPLVNRLREDVRRWRDKGYPLTTPITRQLLHHWGSPERARRLFFCQREAVETIIYLNEVLAAGRQPKWTPELSHEDYQRLMAGEPVSFTGTTDRSIQPTLIDRPPITDAEYKALYRNCCKMATGSGKTVVMSMVIAWAFCNYGKDPSSGKFPGAALIICPNLTIKERLNVLRPDDTTNYYRQFDIVPSSLLPLMQQGKVSVRNWQQLKKESPHWEGGETFRIVNKGDESPDAFARRILGDLYGTPLIVLNDEAHHAYRPRQLNEEESKDLSADEKEEREEATVWVEALDRIHHSHGIKVVVDVSATPFYIKGSGYTEGAPFPWIVSDFGLVDAIESGIVKIPRLPVADNTGRPEPKFYSLWKHIMDGLTAGQKLPGGRPKPEVVWERAEDALQTLASAYVERYQLNENNTPNQLSIPPVMIIVCDNTNIAELFYNNISGETQIEVEVEDNGKRKKKNGDGKKTEKRTSYGQGKVQANHFQNYEGQEKRTLRIDTKLLNEAESGSLEGSKKEQADRLRSVLASVGRKGMPGEQVRCVVSVQMLTEGWDANNVTHILGLRAFGSQLLIEQVVGRGLRRMSYDPDPETGLLPAEYVDVYGIPFSIIPFKGKASNAPSDDDIPPNHVRALPEREHLKIEFPVVDGFVFDLKRNLIKADVTQIERLVLEPFNTPTGVFVQPQVGYRDSHPDLSSIFDATHQDRQSYYENNHLQTIIFEISRNITRGLTDGLATAGQPKLKNIARHQLFPQVFKLVNEYVETRIDFRGLDKREIGLETYSRKILDLLLTAIEPDNQEGEPPLLPRLNRYKAKGSTTDVHFTTKKPVRGTIKSHVNLVVADTKTWEQSAAYFLESSPLVISYVKNTSGLEFNIPYEFDGVSGHYYVPDFIVRLTNGVSLILEIKGENDSKDDAKHQAAKRWVKAVNNWGEMGTWAFDVCRDVQRVPEHLKKILVEA